MMIKFSHSKEELLPVALRYWRSINGYSQADIAEVLLVSQSAVWKWEKGRSVPTLFNFLCLLEFYEIDSVVQFFSFPL